MEKTNSESCPKASGLQEARRSLCQSMAKKGRSRNRNVLRAWSIWDRSKSDKCRWLFWACHSPRNVPRIRKPEIIIPLGHYHLCSWKAGFIRIRQISSRCTMRTTVLGTELLLSCSVVSNPLQPHGVQHARLPSSSLSPGACSNSCPWSQWCHSTISSSIVPLSSCLQSFPASGSFPVSQFFPSGGQSIGVSASALVLPMNIQDWFPLGWTGWISLQSEGLSRVFSNTTVQKHQFFGTAFFMVQLSHPYMTTGKTIVMTRWTFVGKVMSLIFNMLSRLVTVFLPRSKRLLISWLQSPSALILEPKKINTEWASVNVCPNDFIYIQRTKKMNLLKRPGGMIRKLHN